MFTCALFSALSQSMGKSTCQSSNFMILNIIGFLNDCEKQSIVMLCKTSTKMMWYELKVLHKMCHLGSYSKKCPWDFYLVCMVKVDHVPLYLSKVSFPWERGRERERRGLTSTFFNRDIFVRFSFTTSFTALLFFPVVEQQPANCRILNEKMFLLLWKTGICLTFGPWLTTQHHALLWGHSKV